MSKELPNLRFIVPNGIQRFEGGGGGYQWFSLRDFTQQAMQKGLASVSFKIADWIKLRLQELNLNESNLYLAGFSQGGMLSLYLAASGLVFPSKVISFSGMFVPPIQKNTELKQTKVLAIHGDKDEVLPINMSQASYTLLSKYGMNDFKFLIDRNIAHHITNYAIEKGTKFLKILIKL
jgi:phospholipase/carboxylesterase